MDVRHGWFAALCPVCGLEVLSPGPESRQNARLELSTGRVITLISHGRFPVIQHGGGVSHQILVSGQDGVAYVVTEIDWGVRRLGNLYGRMADWTADGRAAWQDTRETYRIDGDPKVYDAPLPDGASGGFMGDPRWPGSWPEYWSANPHTALGVTVFNPMVSPDNAWVIGNHPDKPVHLAHDVEADVLYEAGPSFNTPIAPRVVMRNGEPVIVRSYPSGLLTRDQFVPYVNPRPDEIHIPTFEPFDGCVALFFDPTGKPTIAPVNAQYPAVLPRPVWFTTANRDDTKAAKVDSDREGLPLIVYFDAHGIDLNQIPAGAHGMVHACPSATESIVETVEAVRKDLQALKDAGITRHMDLAAYCQWKNPERGYALTEQQVIDSLPIMINLGRMFDVVGYWGFAYERFYENQLIDGLRYWPNVQKAWSNLYAAARNPNAFPVRASQPAPTPRPEPQPQPVPVPVPVPPPAPAAFYDRARSL